MKIRNGFVSNSSSSSFVLAFPKVIASKQDVVDILFNGKLIKDIRDKWWREYNNDRVTSDEAAQYFYFNSKLITDDFIDNLSVTGEWDCHDFIGDREDFIEYYNNPFRLEYWEVLDVIGTEHAKYMIQTYKDENPNKHLYIIEVGNECGYIPSFMENSDIYKNVDIAFYTNKH